MAVTWSEADQERVLGRLAAIVSELPDVVVAAEHGHTGYLVRGKRFAWLLVDHHGDGRLGLWIKAPREEQEGVVGADPVRYFVPPYLGPRGWIGANLRPADDPEWDEITALIEQGWRMSAGVKAGRALDAARARAKAKARGAVSASELIRPMLAVAGRLPTSDAGWGYEMKWDGVRAVVYLERGTVRIYSRNDRDVSVSYPELGGLAGAFDGQEIVLDGEIVAFDERGRPNFGRLQQRMHVADAATAAQLSRTVPAVFLAFDLLRLDGHRLTAQPYSQRRELLEHLDVDGPSWHTPPVFAGSAADALAASREQGLEGVLAKRIDSVYRPGTRSSEWTKVKNIRTQEVVIGGWRPGQGRRTDTIGSLLMGVPGPDGLAYVGHVGTGFTQAMLAELSRRLIALRVEESPFARELPRTDARDAQWVRPSLVGEVAFAERTEDDRLRHPSWRGLRPDKAAKDVVPE